jgi:hypothetical protein
MPFDGISLNLEDRLRKIEAVIDLVDTPEKWCKGALRSYDGRHCIRGAVRAVSGADALEPQIIEAIGEVAGKRFRRIEAFNDHPNTCHAQVLAVLNRVRYDLGAGSTVGKRGVGASWRAALGSWLKSGS